jgi:aldehyde dehydrogenase (NAD(P)+)
MVTGTVRGVAAPAWAGDVDAKLATLAAHKGEWASLPIAARIRLVEQVRRGTLVAAAAWVAAASSAKGLAPGSTACGEEWSSGPYGLIYSLNRWIETLRQLDSTGAVAVGHDRVRVRDDGQVVVEVFPETGVDRFLMSGVRAEVWMDPRVTADALAGHVGGAYRAVRPGGGVALVLGAGNISSIAPLDVLHKLLAEHRVVLLKLNPVNDYLEPIFASVFDPLITAGYVALVTGGPEVGEYAARHPDVDQIHMTGSDRTHDSIVWGDDGATEERRRRGTPFNPRPISSELGNVTPLIVVPGPWDGEDIAFQAMHIATTKLHNSGFNCIATQVLVMPAAWEHSAALLDAVRAAIHAAPARPAYYPGALDRLDAVRTAYPSAQLLNGRLLVSHLQPTEAGQPLFRQECFAPALGVVPLGGDSVRAYLSNAVEFCNRALWGTLGATILVHPATLAELGPDLDAAIAELRYGTVGVNVWCGIGFLLSQLPWGAYPGHSIDDVQSGVGTVHNTAMFDAPQRSVLYAPFHPYPRSLLMSSPTLLPKPPWFLDHRQGAHINELLTRYEFSREPEEIKRILLASLRG